MSGDFNSNLSDRNPNADSGFGELPVDLHGVDAALAASARADAGEPDHEFERRVSMASMPILRAGGLGSVRDGFEQLAERERAAAPAGLVSSVVEASWPLLTRDHAEAANTPARNVTLHLAGQGGTRVVVRPRGVFTASFSRRVASLAAVVLLGGLGVLIVQSLKGGAGQTPGVAPPASLAKLSTQELDQQLSERFDTLLTALGDSGLSESASAEDSANANSIEQFYEEGSS